MGDAEVDAEAGAHSLHPRGTPPGRRWPACRGRRLGHGVDAVVDAGRLSLSRVARAASTLSRCPEYVPLWATGPVGARSSIRPSRPETEASGSPLASALACVVRSGVTPYWACTPPRWVRKPDSTSSKMKTMPCSLRAPAAAPGTPARAECNRRCSGSARRKRPRALRHARDAPSNASTSFQGTITMSSAPEAGTPPDEGTIALASSSGSARR